jgi:hypothetical protein
MITLYKIERNKSYGYSIDSAQFLDVRFKRRTRHGLALLFLHFYEGDVRFSSTRPRPSKLAHAVDLESKGTQMRSSIESGNNMGRKLKVWGQIGEIKIAGISG